MLKSSMYIQYEDVFLEIYMINLSTCTVKASYTTELVVELATICRVNIQICRVLYGPGFLFKWFGAICI